MAGSPLPIETLGVDTRVTWDDDSGQGRSWESQLNL